MTQARSLSYVHRFVPGEEGKGTLLLLHGTGGDENDLLDLGRAVAPGAALLSPRGQVLENGAPRFFRRFAEGRFDEDDVRVRARDLAGFIGEARAAYDIGSPWAVGFSNGANIAAAILLLDPQALSGGVLLRAMVPLSDPPRADLAGKSILLLSGASDPIIPPTNAANLSAILQGAGGDVEHRVVPGGHGLTAADVSLASAWLRARNVG
jgi:phospholipase/carboxylesterase